MADRRVEIAGQRHLHGASRPLTRWKLVSQIGGNLTYGQEGFLRECRFLVHERATVFTRELVLILP